MGEHQWLLKSYPVLVECGAAVAPRAAFVCRHVFSTLGCDSLGGGVLYLTGRGVPAEFYCMLRYLGEIGTTHGDVTTKRWGRTAASKRCPGCSRHGTSIPSRSRFPKPWVPANVGGGGRTAWHRASKSSWANRPSELWRERRGCCRHACCVDDGGQCLRLRIALHGGCVFVASQQVWVAARWLLSTHGAEEEDHGFG